MPIHLHTLKPSEIQAVFISDLHLSIATPRLSRAFLALIDELQQLPNLHSLYILGDWLDAWLGDDDYLNSQREIHWLHSILQALATLRRTRSINIYIMHGNRDFSITQRLCDCFGGQLIFEPFNLANTVRLEHGDALCTDDVKYQRYRRLIRHPWALRLLLALPLKYRQKLAHNIKDKSANDKQQKSICIMDVNADAVTVAMAQHTILIHGHTHRPAVHQLTDHKTRIVLGDWRENKRDNSVGAQILASSANTPSVDTLHLVEFSYQEN